MENKYLNWLTEDFLRSVLQGQEVKKPTVNILSFTVEPGVAPGSNYTSRLFRVHVNFKIYPSTAHQSLSLIIKEPSSQGMFYELSEKLNFFGKEPKLYNKLLPRMFQKLKCEFAPKSYLCPLKNILVLNDLKPEGYVVISRFKQLDFLHCKLVIEKLAKYHATSVACFHDDPDLIEIVGAECFFVKGGPFEERMKPWLEASFRQCAKTLSSVGGYQEIVDLLLSRADGVWDSLLQLCKPKTDCLNVLNHGDCWSSNLLFKYSISGEVDDVKFIDFQLGRLGSPVLDLIFFVWSTANEEVRENKQQVLYDTYLQALNETFEELGCEERYTNTMLKKDLRTASDWILATICFVLAFVMCETENFIDVGSLTTEQLNAIDTDSRFPKLFTNINYKPLLPGIARQLKKWVLN